MERPIDYWRRLYLAHAQLDVFQRHVHQSQKYTREFLATHPNSYVSWSGGKDSTALLHLVWRENPDIQVMTEKDDLDFPEELPYVHMMQQKYDLRLDIISPPVNLWEVVQQHTMTEDIHSHGIDFSEKYFYALIKQYRKAHDFEGVFLGLRKEESHGRLLNRCQRGIVYQRQGEWVCQPLADWTGKDVFAYLFSQEIPILPIYFKTQFVDSPEEIRKAWVLPSAQARKGQAVWLKYYYPEIFNRLKATNPELERYV